MCGRGKGRYCFGRRRVKKSLKVAKIIEGMLLDSENRKTYEKGEVLALYIFIHVLNRCVPYLCAIENCIKIRM